MPSEQLMPERLWRSPGGSLCRIVETQQLVGDTGWRWGRKRAIRYAAHMNSLRDARDFPSHRYAVQALGWGRWQIIALQNLAVPVA